MLDRRVAPTVRPFGRLILPAERVERLNNGARLHIVSDLTCPMLRLCLVASGGKDEACDQATAIMGAQMLTEGSARYSEAATADLLDYHGARLHGRATDHHTRLDLSVQPDHLAALIPLLKDIVASPTIAPARLDACKAQHAARCRYDLTRVDHLAFAEAIKMTAGADHPAAKLPTAESFMHITCDDMLEYLARLWQADGVDIFLSGRVDARTENLVRELAEAIPAGAGMGLHIVPFCADSPATHRIYVEHAEQCAVQCTIPSIGRSHPDYIPLRLAVTALGGHFGSRLMQNIREDKGYTYGITASLNGVQDGSYVDISAECAPQYTDALIQEIGRELEGMHSRLLSPDEMLRMRLYEQTRLAAVLDNAITAADHYLTALSVGMPADYFARQEHITATITPEQIADTAARHLQADALRIAIAGPTSR